MSYKQARAQHAQSIGEPLVDGSLVEAIVDPGSGRTRFAVAAKGTVRILDEVVGVDGRKTRPIPVTNNLLSHGVVLLPTGVSEFGDKEQLLGAIASFIHRYVDLSPVFEQIVAHYVLLTWIYDDFEVLPYVRVRGEPGSGKTRMLRVAGSISYRPIFASGASTVSPVFRILDLVRGTLVLDEGDFRASDERSQIAKILNNGHARGFPVLRSEASPRDRVFNPTAFHVFGPKLVASRNGFEDRALESRFLTERLGVHALREGLPVSLPREFDEEATALRNQLLAFRFAVRGSADACERVAPGIHPRINQVFGPLLGVIDDPWLRNAVIERAEEVHRQDAIDRAGDVDMLVLRAADAAWERLGAPPTVAQVAREVPVSEIENASPRWVGDILRRRLGLRTERGRDGYALIRTERSIIRALLEKVGLAAEVHDVHDTHNVHGPGGGVKSPS